MSDSPYQRLTLDQLAADLLQLEADDASGVERLRQALHALASSVALPVITRVVLDEAAQALDAAVAAGDGVAAALEVVGQKLEQAMGEATSGKPASAVVAPPAAAAAPVAGVPSQEPLPEDADLDLLKDFITESRETLIAAEAALLDLEGSPDNDEAINTVFRAFHTIKGTAAFLGLSRASEFAHHAESLLSRVRDREIGYVAPVAELSLRSTDLLKDMVDGIDTALQTGQLPIPAEYATLMHAVMTLVETPASEIAAMGTSAPTEPEAPVAAPAPVAAVAVAPSAPPRPQAPVAAPAPTPAAVPSIAPAAASAAPQRPAAAAEARRPGDAASVESTVRVRTEKLDQLIDMIGELVIAQSMIAGNPLFGTGTQHDLSRKVSHAGKIVRELQDLSMSMRMIPLKATFQKMTRLVRDVSLKAGKAVEFVTSGEETEIDRNMVDVIGDPLVHMLRNAIDHGIERPDDRVRAGKPRVGTVELSAFHASGNVVVMLRDDGKGLDRDRIFAKAVERGLVSPDATLSDHDVYNLIFAPGFSTADKITDLSGRGVGMDVVKRHIESLRGKVEIDSVPGQGTTFRLKLPLTLAITDGMLVRVGHERYIVPMHHIHMSFRPEPGQISTVTGKGEVVLLRGEVMPMVRLHRLYDVPGAVTEPGAGILMIVGDDERRSALLVDELLGQQQVVVKTLGSGIGKIEGVSGGAILGDGRVGLILDVKEIVALFRTGGTARAA